MVEQPKSFAAQIADEIVPEDSDLTEAAYRLQWRLARDAAEAARARILAALREPDAELHYVMKEALAEAYASGALAVHHAWVNGTNGNDPDFGEAASDYGSHHATAALAAAADHMETRDAG